MKKCLMILLLIVTTSAVSYGQKLAVKTNLLYDATATINLGVEFGLGKKTTLDISANYNGWMLNESKQTSYKHFMILPEYRYWLCERFSGHFFGLHAGYMNYNVSNTLFSNNRYDGDMYGAGISYGYQLYIAKRWNLEATLGAGYARRNYDTYDGVKRDNYVGKTKSNYWGLTKAGITLIYIIN